MYPGGKSVIYFHRGCNDGRLAASLLVRSLVAGGQPDIELRSLSPAMREFGDRACAADRAFFVDLFPPEELVETLENMYLSVTVVDHHATPAALRERLRGRARWDVTLDAGLCAAALVAKQFPCPDVAKFARALRMADKYDRWIEPSDRVFAWMFASQILWDGLGPERTDVARCLAYTDALAAATKESMRALGLPVFGPLKTMFRLQRPIVLRLADPAPEWDGTAIAMVRNDALNPSIACHWMLQAHPGAEVALMIHVTQESGQTAYRASVRSRTLDTTRFVPGARGHPCASGCELTQAQMDSAQLME